MPRIEISEHIQASPQAVWDFISNIRRGPEWVTVMKEVLSVSAGELGVGSVYRERSQIGPSLSETEWHITTFDPPRLQVHQCKEPTLRAVLALQVEPEAGGSRLLHRTDYQLMPVFRPLGWLVEKVFAHRTMTAAMQQTVQNGKRIIESEQGSQGRPTR